MSSTTLAPRTLESLPAEVRALPWFQPTQRPDVLAALVENYAGWVGDCDPAKELEILPDYVQGVEEWAAGGHSAVAFLAEDGVDLPEDTEEAPLPANPLAGGSVVAAAEKAEATEEEAKAAARTTLAACVKAFSKGERAYSAGMLESGRLAHQYITQRLTLGDTRRAIVKALEGALAVYASDTIDTTRLVKAHYAYALLTEGMAKAPRAPYSHYRDCYCRLVDTVNPGLATESFRLLPGLEAEAKALFVHCTTNELSRDGVAEQVSELAKRYTTLAAEVAKAEQQAKADAAAKLEREAKAANAAREQAEQQAKATKAAAEQATDDTAKAELARQAAAEQAAADQRAAEAKAANVAASDATKAVAVAAKVVEQAVKAETKAHAVKPERTASREAASPPSDTSKQGANLLAVGKAGTAKDAGAMAAEIVAANADPIAALRAFALAFNRIAPVSLDIKRAVSGLVLLLERSETSVPLPATAVASKN